MKKISLFFFFIQSILAWSQIGLPIQLSNVSKNHLVVNYDFSNASSYSGTGTAVTNIASALTETATLINTPSVVSSPGYVSFNGLNQYFITPNLKPYFKTLNSGSQESHTLSLWVNPINNSGNIVSELGQVITNYGWHDSQIEMVNGYVKFRVWAATPTSLTSINTIALNKWHHIAMVYDGTTLKGYIDGVLQGTVTVDRAAPWEFNYNLHYAIAALDETHMGSGAFGKFNLAQFKMYNIALNNNDIAQEFNREKYLFQNAIILDAGNSNSYTGTGTTWYDISGNQKNVTNYSCVYNASLGGGSFFYDGANSYTDFAIDVTTVTTLTVETWVKINTNTNAGMIFGWNMYDVWNHQEFLGYNTGNGDAYGLSLGTVNSLGIIGNWKHLVFVMNTGSYLSNKIYVNGVLQSLSQQSSSQNLEKTNFNSGLGRISGWKLNTNYKQEMNMATFKIYNRELNSTEIALKFTSEKARYGL